jgi:HemY protein
VIAALAAGAVAVARYNTGYALLVFPPYRLEVSLNLFLVLLALAFVLGYLAVRAILAALRLPLQVQEHRATRRKERAYGALVETVREYLAGRYARAEKAAARCIALGEHTGLASALAARSAHELRAPERRDAYLTQGTGSAAGDDIVRVVTEAELLVAQRRHQEALAVLAGLPQKHTAALRLELRAQQLARNWDQVMLAVDQLEKREVFDAEHAEQLRRHGQAERFARLADDPHALEEAWQKLAPRQKKDTRIALAAARSFIACGKSGRAREIIEVSLDAAWDSELVALYAECSGGALSAIERAESWLKSHPQDSALLLALGELCVQQALWGKAQSYIEASLALEPTYAAHLALARLHEHLGNADAAQRNYRASLDLAVRQLRDDAAKVRQRPIP